MSSLWLPDEERVLVVAPTARDARLSQELFARAGLPCGVCSNLGALAGELCRGAGVLVLTEEALAPERRQLVLAALAAQPTWSSLPVVLLAGSGPRQLLSAPLVQQLGNVVVLDRPVSAQALLGVVRMALQTRRRQYQARLVAAAARLLSAAPVDSATLDAFGALLVPQLADCCLLYAADGGLPAPAMLSFAAAYQEAKARLQELLSAGEGAAERFAREHGSPQTVGAAGAATAVVLARQHLELLGASDTVVVALETHGQQFGALAAAFLAPGLTFRAEERQTVHELAGQLAPALNQARLYHAEQAARAAAEAAVCSRDDVFAVISHDLNNPLTALLGQVQLLQRQLARNAETPERVLDRVAAIEQAARRMQAQIGDLLDLSRLEAGRSLELRYEPTDLVALARRAINAAQQGTAQHAISLATRLPALLARVDAGRIARVVDNLLSNAVKYSPRGGPISVAIEVEQADQQRWAVLRVQDEGMGIPAAELDAVFERFRRASNVRPEMPGTGLGLASVRQIVEQHGGQITVASSPGQGSCFTVRLPV